MSLITIPNIFSAGAVIVASQHNANFSVISSDYNGNIDNTNIAPNAAIAYSKLNIAGLITNGDLAGSIADSKLLTISTAGKVNASTLTSLSSTPSGAGVFPIANIATGTPTGSKYVRDDGTLQTITLTSKSILTSNASYTSSATSYSCPGDSSATSTQTDHVMVIPVAGTIKNLYAATSNVNAGTMAITVYKNNSAQTLTATIASLGTAANDTTHSFSVAAGDTISFENINGRSGAKIVSVSVEIDV